MDNNGTKRWQIYPRIPVEVDEALTGYSEYFRQILFNRGLMDRQQARLFLTRTCPTPTDPFLMAGMTEAVERMHRAVAEDEPVAIYGDYDVDGVTSTALLVELMQRYGARVEGYIPNRFEEGYGLNNEALDSLANKGVRLVVTVDCGIRSPNEARHAAELGLDLIISDHHHPGEELPAVVAVVNPRQAACGYPDKDLAGVGLAYKIAQAMLERHPIDGVKAEDWLDLVALGTVADLAPLTGENRALVAGGLKLIREGKRQGVRSLCGAAGIEQINRISAGDIGFMLGPRLNAAGRLTSALNALDLLLSKDVQQAGVLAQELNRSNTERQVITRDVQDRAAMMCIEKNPEALLLFAADPDFNEGVVGLAASRLVDKYHRPAIVAHRGEEFTRASCRSIPQFHITEALDQCADLLVRHGGHKAAAGFTVQTSNLEKLLERLNQIASEKLSGMDLRPVLKADAELKLHKMGPGGVAALYRELEYLQPTGYGNPEAVFISRGLEVRNVRLVGKDGAHLKMNVKDQGVELPAIAFKQGEWAPKLNQKAGPIDILYTLEINEFNGNTSFQLNVRDLKLAGCAD